jgi:hypothetical protein
MIKSLIIGFLISLFFVGGTHGGNHLLAWVVVWLVISGVTYIVLEDKP